MRSLKNHPFAVEAFFERSLVLTFAVPKKELQGFIPECLTLDTYDDRWAFLAIAMVQTKSLRPKGFPKFLGNDFFLIGYRIFVRYTNRAGKRLRGLYIIKSQTNKSRMGFFGNLFTHYNYTTTDIKVEGNTIRSRRSDFEVVIDSVDDATPLPLSSPFPNWKDARKYAGPLPHTFTVNNKEKTVLTILGVRQHWKPRPVKVTNYHFEYLNRLDLKGLVLASAFEINDIPYAWEKGKIEKWK